MTVFEARKARSSIADLHARLDARRGAERAREQEIAELSESFERAKALWLASDDATAAEARTEAQIASLEARTRQLAETLRQQTEDRRERSGRLQQRLATLEQTDARLADKIALFLPDDKDELWNQAMKLLASGQRDQGRRYLQVFIDRFPQDLRASRGYLSIGLSYAETARFAEAAATYQRLLSNYPTSPEAPAAMWQLSRAFKELSFCSDARALLRNLVDRYPKSQEAVGAAKELKSLARPKSECVG
ncbi:MAG TPA: tetratricopeptide repeat protein [Polyangia bacterium]